MGRLATFGGKTWTKYKSCSVAEKDGQMVAMFLAMRDGHLLG